MPVLLTIPSDAVDGYDDDDDDDDDDDNDDNRHPVIPRYSAVFGASGILSQRRRSPLPSLG